MKALSRAEMINTEYGLLTVKEKSTKENNGRTKWICECVCGNKIETSADNLRQGKKTSCGHCSLSDKTMLLKWSISVRNRDRQCKKCGTTKALHAHHIIPKQIEKTRYDVNNGITLCLDHHNEFHRLYGDNNFGPQQINEYLKEPIYA